MRGSVAAQSSSVFVSDGSAVFVGFYESFSLGWGRMGAFTKASLEYSSDREGVKDAMVELDMYLHLAHGKTGNWLSLCLGGDGNFKPWLLIRCGRDGAKLSR